MLGPLVELAGNHGRWDVLAATIDHELGAGLGAGDRDVGQADRAADAEAGAAAGDRADHGGPALARRAGHHRLAGPRDRAGFIGDLEAGELAAQAALLLVAQRLGADDLAVELD